MSTKLAERAAYARKVRIAKTIVLSLASVVVLSLIVAFVFGIYNYTTDKPAKALFGIDEGKSAAQ